MSRRKPDVSVYHPVMGRSVKNGATGTCSKCGHTIPEEHVPLMLWNNSGKLMWVYCERCDAVMLKLLGGVFEKKQTAALRIYPGRRWG